MATIATTVPQQHIATYPAPVILTAPPEAHPSSAHKQAFLGLGITQVAIGVLCLILGGISLVPSVAGTFAYVASGIWGGLWFIATGSVGIASGLNTNSCNVVTGLILTILSAFVAFGVLIAEAVVASAGSICITYGSAFNCPGEAFEGIHATIAVLAAIEFIVTIVHSAYCCRGTCCAYNTRGSMVASSMTVTTTNYPPMNMSQIPGQPYGQQQQYYPPQTQGYVNYAGNQPQQTLQRYGDEPIPQPQTQYATNIEEKQAY